MINILQHDAPLDIFQTWFNEAKKHEKEASGFSLATVSASHRVSNRYLLFKGIYPCICPDKKQRDSLSFVTNFESDKSNQLKSNQYAAMNFYWENWHRQVRIEGKAYQLDNNVSDKLFLARSEDSRLASLLSKQSKPLDNYEDLKNHFQEVKKDPKKFNIDLTKRPSTWGAYGLIPDRFIFFEYGEHRLNKRIEFTLNQDGIWESNWLNP